MEDVFGKILETKIKLKIVLNKEVGLAVKTPLEADPAEEKTPPGEQKNLLSSALEILGGKVIEE